MNKLISILIRYAILVLVAIPNLYLFYLLLTPLTLYPVYFILHLFTDAVLSGSTILLSGKALEIIPACIAGSAYYLLLILNLSVPNIKFPRRIKMILISFLSLLLLNILRILLMSILFISGSAIFEFVHLIFWYAISIIFVVAIWFAEVKIFKIKSVPFYSDIQFLRSLIK